MWITEEKVHYNGRVDRVECLFLREDPSEIVLLYRIPRDYQGEHFHLPAGTFTIAYYYFDRPYNLYHWVTPQGTSIGYYFNMVKDVYREGNLLSYRDLIIDIFVRNDGSHLILDIDELPCALESFEDGKVQDSIKAFLRKKAALVSYYRAQSQSFVKEGCFNRWPKK